MSTRITLHNDKKSIYDICIESSFDNLPRELGQLDISRRRLCIVSDSAVAGLYLNELEALLTSCAREVISFVSVSYTHLDVYKRQTMHSLSVSGPMKIRRSWLPPRLSTVIQRQMPLRSAKRFMISTTIRCPWMKF